MVRICNERQLRRKSRGLWKFLCCLRKWEADFPPVGLIRYSTDSDHDSVYYSGVGPYAGDGLTDKLEVEGSNLMQHIYYVRFYPSGLESCTIPVQESLIDKVVNVGTDASIYNYALLQQTPRPIYCVYYSGDPIVNFTNWWNRS